MQTAYLDISNKGVLPTIYAKQGDVGRKFLAIITDNGTIISGLQSPVFSVWYEGASGSGNYSAIDDRPAVVFDGKKAEVEMIAQMLVNAGKGQMTIVLNDALGKQIGLWNIEYCVEPVAGQGSEEAKDYYTALSETAARAIAAAEMAENAAAGFYVDNTLTQEGASADAKATGDKIELLQDALDSKVSTETTRVESVEEITENGYYNVYVDTLGAEGVYQFHAVAQDKDNIDLSNNALRRTKTTGSWGEWEWKTPPMYLGNEYRTAERFEGKPVYTQLIYCGTAVSEGRTTQYGETLRVIRHSGTTPEGVSIPFGNPGSNYHLKADASNSDITVYCGAGFVGKQVYVQIWYTRD